jgi:hypothetical protein
MFSGLKLSDIWQKKDWYVQGDDCRGLFGKL